MSMEPAARKFRIFVIEDNLADVQLLRMALKAADLDCELTVIDDGRDALDFAQQRGRYAGVETPDLAVLDLNLPKNDGLEILEALRANRTFSEIPVAVISSSSSPRERARIERFRIGRFIAKPPDLEEYLAIGKKVKELLIESHTRRDSAGA